MQKNERLSISDFHLTPLVNQNEIEQLLGGLQAPACHIEYTNLSQPGTSVNFVAQDSDDCQQ